MYDLRYSKSKTDVEDNSKWDSLTSLNQDDLIEGTLDPVEGGNPVQLKLNPQLFDADIDYFMAMKATDERNTVSAKSNVATITRLVPPGQVADLTSEVMLKFMFSKKATINYKIFTVDLTLTKQMSNRR